MGLGKTLQCIAFIAHMIEKGVKGPFLVAAPLSTVPNWVAEFKRFTPEVCHTWSIRVLDEIFDGGGGKAIPIAAFTLPL